MDDTDELAMFLKSLDVPTLGSGDAIVGVNLLTCMACTLANLAPDDGAVSHPDGSPARLGTSLMVMGSASTGRVVDEIITEVNRRQNNITSHLQCYFDWVEEIKAKPGLSQHPPRSGIEESATLVCETQPEYGEMHPDNVAAWHKVLEQLPQQTIGQIGKQSKFIVSVGGRKDIKSQFTRLRPGCPLVHLGLSKPEDLSQYYDVGAALLEGRFPLDDGSRTVKGNILMTDPMNMMMAAARNSDERTSWLGQLLWLSDGDFGPDAPPVTLNTQPSVVRLEQRFRNALGRILIYRLNLPHLQPLVLFTDTREAMVRWSSFLREMEPQLPGISGAARNLLTSLVFGLGVMATKASKITLAGIESMARFQVRRMVNLRTAILHDGDLTRKRKHITRIFHKLETGPANGRKFCRDLKLTAADRDEALRWLEAASLVTQSRDEWQLREGARLCFKECTFPVIEV